MIKIVDYIIIENELYFFAEGKKQAYTAKVVCELSRLGATDITSDQVAKLISEKVS